MTMRQRLAHIALGGVLVLSGMIASSFLQTAESQQSHTEIVKAREFHVVNAYGATTAVIASRPEGLAIQNAVGKTVAGITTDSGGSKLVLFNARDQISVLMGSSSKQNGMMSIYSAAGKGGVFVAAEESGGYMSIQYATGKDGVFVAADEEYGGGMAISNAKSQTVVSIGHNDEKNSGILSVNGESGSVEILANDYGGKVSVFGKGSNGSRAIMGVNEYGNGAVSTWDKNGYRLGTLR